MEYNLFNKLIICRLPVCPTKAISFSGIYIKIYISSKHSYHGCIANQYIFKFNIAFLFVQVVLLRKFFVQAKHRHYQKLKTLSAAIIPICGH